MPAVGAAALRKRARVLHERDALALDRPRDEHRRTLLLGAKAGEGGPQRGVVVPVAGGDVPAERAQLRLEVAEREDLLGRLVGLELVAVDNDPEARETFVRSSLQRLPVLALLELAVADHHHHPPAAAEMPFRPRDPTALRDPHPERARVRLDPRHADVRVAVEPAEPPQPQQLLGREHPQRVQRRVEPGHVVPLRREEDVAIRARPARLGRVQLLEQQLDDDVERREARPEVAGAGPLDGDERVGTAHVGEQRELRVGVAAPVANALELRVRDDMELGHRPRR